MPERVMQAEDPADLRDPALPGRRIRDGEPDRNVAQIAGALSALAGRVDRLGEQVGTGLRPRVTADDRRKALDMAREFISDLGLPPRYERVHAELAVARYLTGE